MNRRPLPYADTKPTKAVVAAVGALATGVGAAASDGRLTWIELVIAGCAAVVTGCGVWTTSNPKK